MKKGLLIILSGPSGAGKGTVYKSVMNAMPELKISISVTTRKPRDGEIDGIQYYFKTEEEFNNMKANGEFLESAKVYDHFYGTPQAPVFEMLSRGEDVLFEIDIAGAKQIKEKYPESIAIFIIPPSFEILKQRLCNRGTETEESLKMRLGSAHSELAQYGNFDYIVFNDKVERATEQIVNIIKSERNTALNVTYEDLSESDKELKKKAERNTILRNRSKIEKMLKTKMEI